MEKEALIYKITNKINNYIYVGSTTKTLEERFSTHLKRIEERKEESLFYKDLATLGVKNFSIELLDTCYVRHRFIIEEYWFNKLLEEGNCLYDIKRGSKHSKNTKQRLSLLRQEREKDYKTPEFKEKMSEATRGEKNGMFNKKDENAVNGRIIIAYKDKEMTEIAHTFPSLKMALNFLQLKGHTKLLKSCREKTLYYGFYWKKEWVER